ncbi:MAG TPA: zinc-ribbon and DUF3426 domain-containing protein [Rhodanobacteraceae bacterium]|nr:zinc-ribbon and DUF3426 domain-containing protein [Rhodanobacteraceae bacterium]
MYTQCPECLTIFEIDESDVQASLGIVHCGHCARRFDALRTLSDTLPAEPNAPLAEQYPAELAPTLTDKVSPAAFRLTMRRRGPGNDMMPDPPARESAAEEMPADPAAGEDPSAGSEQPSSGDNTDDWFADLESELAPSLAADRAAPLPVREADYTWRVSDLSAQSRFPGPDIPVTLAGTGTNDASLDVERETRETHRDEPADTVGNTPNAAMPEDFDTPLIAQTEIPFDEPDAFGPETPGRADEDMAPPWLDAFDDGMAGPADLISGEADPGTAEPHAGPPASLPPAQDAAEATDAATAEAVATSPEGESVPPATPVYVRPRRSRATGAIWLLGCLLLALVLAAQLAWAKRTELFRNPATHAWAARVCEVVDCHLPPIKAIAKLEMVSRDVRPDPRASGALMVTATVRNGATFRQPWPTVVVALTDLDNNPVAMRRFRPAEYMPDSARRAAGIAPGATVAIAFEVADPGKRASGFRFSFE